MLHGAGEAGPTRLQQASTKLDRVHACWPGRAARSLRQLAQVLQQYPQRRVLLEGFADGTGSKALNQRLSERVEVRGFGDDLPVADNCAAAGRRQNRRVEVLFSDACDRLNCR